MASRITEDVMSTALAFAYGKFIAVTCLTPILASPMSPLLLFDRLVCNLSKSSCIVLLLIIFFIHASLSFFWLYGDLRRLNVIVITIHN